MIGFTDATSATQVLAISNTNNVEIGSGTPSAQISVQGKAVLQAGVLSSSTVNPGAAVRYVGSVTVPASSTATVSGATFAGFGVATGGGILTKFASATSFLVANPDTINSATFTYAVI